MIYKYLFDHQLIHDKQPIFESLQTHQLAEYLLNIIYPGYPACKAKNLAYTDYRLWYSPPEFIFLRKKNNLIL